MTKEIPNYEKQIAENPLYGLGVLIGGSEAIEAQERHSTSTAANVSALPTCGLHQYGPGGPFESLGIKIGKPMSSDPKELFTSVELPLGWKIKRTDHPMWNDIVDEKGRRRASYFFKGAFYDRNAHMSAAERRFRITTASKPKAREYDDQDFDIAVIDAGTAVWNDHGFPNKESIVYRIIEKRDKAKFAKYWDQDEDIHARLRQWLDQNKPGWNDPANYWD
jgi:hypothetical protein